MICILFVSKMLLQNDSNRKFYTIKQILSSQVRQNLMIIGHSNGVLGVYEFPQKSEINEHLPPKITYEIMVLYNSTRKNTSNHTIIFMSVKQLCGKKFTRYNDSALPQKECQNNTFWINDRMSNTNYHRISFTQVFVRLKVFKSS